MAQENKFLTIPMQEGLFAAVRRERSAEMGVDDEDDNSDDEEEEDVRLIPRCSPVPRKRGHSLADETAEYMRIRLALPRRSVSFADACGGDLVDVRQFVPFDSDDEEEGGNNARWEEEEAKYQKAYRQPTYRVRPDFEPLSGGDLVQAVRASKVEVEGVRPVPGESLSFDSLIRVLNVSFQKSVYVRSTMDGWITYFDNPAEYVHGSNDDETDVFCVRLSFAEPYLFDGARIDFVVRYGTAHGEFWANNLGRNYSVTLQVSYEEDAGQASKVEDVELRGILKPSRYRMEDYNYDFQDKDEGDVAGTEEEAAVVAPAAVCPLVIEPEIDIELIEASARS
ncbi:protein phosphatase 1 regulatory subunit 3A isoform X2 [Colossoma macropomum]|uniref:protein phosphatase 1 regulatory subunit 3A isoform X2 n=1 Tax=Colossoma macropomum TaxID=42526 RepID=UPI001864F94B|nr:protein phosphatase 1 regulatory subunit 3A isoform X2 [Colossoma macropomum]